MPIKPPGDLPYDWDMVLAVRKQIDTPDPAWLHRLGSITAPTELGSGGSNASGLSMPNSSRELGSQGIIANLSTVPITRVGGRS